MVLADLGSKITRALQTMAASSVIDDEVVSKLTSSIAMALLQADVDIRLVKQMQNNIKTQCAMDESAAGANKRKMIQSTVIKEMYKLLDPGVAPYVPKKGKCNVIMFVGLQGSGRLSMQTAKSAAEADQRRRTCSEVLTCSCLLLLRQAKRRAVPNSRIITSAKAGRHAWCALIPSAPVRSIS